MPELQRVGSQELCLLRGVASVLWGPCCEGGLAERQGRGCDGSVGQRKQVRQHVEHKRTFFYLEQVILKHGAAHSCINIKDVHQVLASFPPLPGAPLVLKAPPPPPPAPTPSSLGCHSGQAGEGTYRLSPVGSDGRGKGGVGLCLQRLALCGHYRRPGTLVALHLLT